MFIRAIKIVGQFIAWLFTDPIGAFFQGVVWGAIMTFCAYLSGTFKEYGALAYCIAFFATFFAAILLALLAGWIWTHISHRLGTTKPTFIEYKFQNGRMHLVKKSNIYKEPTCSLAPIIPQTLNILIQQPPLQNRQQRRAQGQGQQVVPNPLATPPAPQQPQEPRMTAFIITMFQKPILPSMFHMRLESIAGALPSTDQSSIDEKWGLVALSNLTEDSRFRIYFNADNNEAE